MTLLNCPFEHFGKLLKNLWNVWFQIVLVPDIFECFVLTFQQLIVLALPQPAEADLRRPLRIYSVYEDDDGADGLKQSQKKEFFGNHWEPSHSKDSLDVSSCSWLSDFNFVLKRKIQQERAKVGKPTLPGRSASQWPKNLIQSDFIKQQQKNEPGKILISD